MSEAKEKIAILGGGLGGLSTAYFLTQDKNWQDRFEVTVYQMGWRLGGKCATGRGPGGRIQEHGIHLFGGGYYNALRMMMDCYEELRRPPKDTPEWPCRFDDAFTPHYTSASLEGPKGQRSPQVTVFPSSDKGPQDAASMNTIGKWLWHIAEIVLGALISELEGDAALLVSPGSAQGQLKAVRAFRARVMHELGGKGMAPPAPGLSEAEVLLGKLGALAKDAQDELESLRQRLDRASPSTRLSLLSSAGSTGTAISFMVALIWGTIFDVLWGIQTFSSLDSTPYHEWLERHGASNGARRSGMALAPIRVLYQYPGGNVSPGDPTGDMGAGAYVHWSLRSFAYLKAPFWHFAWGTGESVVLPLYELLCRRGVKFKFFHKVSRLAVGKDSSGQPLVSSVTMEQQASMKNPGRPYAPLLPAVDTGGVLPCWPAQPLFDQLCQGEDLKKLPDETLESAWSPWKSGLPDVELKAGDPSAAGFDKVVLAISLGALPNVCEELIKTDPFWCEMVQKLPTVETHSLQLWLSERSSELLSPSALKGAARGPLLGCGLAHPYDGFCDHTPLLAKEGWQASGGQVPRALWYFTDLMAASPAQAPVDDQKYPEKRASEALAQGRAFVNGTLLELFDPEVSGQAGPHGEQVFKDALLVAPPGAPPASGGGAGADPLSLQWVRANIQPSDRYVQAPTNSTQYRLKACKTRFSNLVVAGDWAYTGLNVGCVEATIMSGHLAANAVLGRAEGEGLIGYFP